MARPSDIKKKIKMEEVQKPLPQEDTSKQDTINMLGENGYSARNDDGVIMVDIDSSGNISDIISEVEDALIKFNYRGSYGFKYSSNKSEG